MSAIGGKASRLHPPADVAGIGPIGHQTSIDDELPKSCAVAAAFSSIGVRMMTKQSFQLERKRQSHN